MSFDEPIGFRCAMCIIAVWMFTDTIVFAHMWPAVHYVRKMEAAEVSDWDCATEVETSSTCLQRERSN